MKSLISKILLVSVLQIISHHLFAHVTLDYPQGGETFIVGETVTIQWHIAIPHETLNWDLFFSSDEGVTWDTLQLNIPTEQITFSWVVPDILTSQGRIRIFMDNVAQDYLDISMNFTIAPNTMPPLLDAPASDTTIECNVENQQAAIQAWLNNHGGASATNFCGELNWTHDFGELSNDCGYSGNTSVTFTAADDCGITTTIATVTIADFSPPVISLHPTNISVQSDGQGNVVELNTWLNSRGGAQASDLCGNVSWTNNFNGLSNGCGTTGTATVNFNATDECGNSATTTGTFTIVDNLAPDIYIPASDNTIQCEANHKNEIQQWLNVHAGALANDIGGEVVWTNNFTGLNNECGSTGSATVVFTATDQCGNNTSSNATFTIKDNVAPVIITPAMDTSIECGLSDQAVLIQNWLANNGGAVANDNCGNVNWTNNFTVISDSCGPAVNILVTFTAFDECGNTSAVNATFNIREKTITSIPNLPEFDVKIFPNPVDEILHINFVETRDAQLSLLDSFGRPHWNFHGKSKEIFIPVNQFASGVYFLRFDSSHGTYIHKVIISN